MRNQRNAGVPPGERAASSPPGLSRERCVRIFGTLPRPGRRRGTPPAQPAGRRRSGFPLALLLLLAWTASATSTRNDDSCDIAVLPAATLLLPYFEVGLEDRNGETTLVTIANVSNRDTIARVTLWTDRGYPVLTFNVHLTGYDVQAINLWDVIGRGVIGPGPHPATRGKFSDPSTAHDLSACDTLPVELTDAELARVQSALTTGTIPGGCDAAGGVHENAVGYATIDVVDNCSSNTPRDAAYWTRDLRHDNVLLGDYQQLHAATVRSQGGPLVHIRAIPEGRPFHDAGFPRTFYSRFQPPYAPKLDGRQPLPSRFAARWSEGTSLKIWREGRAGTDAPCRDYAADTNLAVADIVTFDEQGNATGLDGRRVELTASTRNDVTDPRFPQNDAESGWMYLDLDRSRRDAFASQAWVIASTRTNDQTPDAQATDVDAVALANGCAPPAEGRIEPPAAIDDSCDIALLPAATLLLPYFEVDFEDPQGQKTDFTITNVSAEERIARVTLWTDYAFPVLTFNVPLAGYGVQTIGLYDVIVRGLLPASECTPGPLSEAEIARMRQAFSEGTVPALGGQAACNNVGSEHENALGYATVDVVRNCTANHHLDAEYWTEDIAWDNVLTGDARHSVPPLDGQASPLVHIRAHRSGVPFERTFYSRFQSARSPRRDGRQPLPSVFAARWISGSPAGFATFYKVWREGASPGARTCARWDDNVRPYVETVVFDEAENATGDVPAGHIPGPVVAPTLPATSFTSTEDATFYPQITNGASAGWMYFNLNPDETETTSNWVVTMLRAGERFVVEADAVALGNGCSAPTPVSEITTTMSTEVIGPRP